MNMRKISLDNQVDGWYYLQADRRKTDSTNSLIVSNKFSIFIGVIWNLRLGHISYNRMKYLNRQYSYIPGATHNACDFCQLSLQKNLPCPSYLNNASDIFELIPLDK